MKVIGGGNQGQITVEAVLILSIFISVAMAGTQLMRDQQFLTRLVEGPWQYMSGMIENGYWAPPQLGRTKHPNQANRHGSPEGDRP